MNDMIGRVLNELMVADNDKRDLKGFTSVKYIYFILCQISILYVISLNPGKRKKRPDAG
jgi:hypothetical protein